MPLIGNIFIITSILNCNNAVLNTIINPLWIELPNTIEKQLSGYFKVTAIYEN